MFRELGCFNVVRVENVDEEGYVQDDFKDIKYGGFLTVTQSGADQTLIDGIKLASENNFTCFNIVNAESSPIP